MEKFSYATTWWHNKDRVCKQSYDFKICHATQEQILRYIFISVQHILIGFDYVLENYTGSFVQRYAQKVLGGKMQKKNIYMVIIYIHDQSG